VRGPQGAFTLAENGLRPRWFVAGGTGLAPLLAMLRRMAEWREPQPARLYFGVEREDQLFLTDALEQLGAALPGLGIVPCVRLPGSGWTGGFVGTPVEALRRDLDAALGNAALGNAAGEVPDLYLCGPPAMIDAAEAAARDCGVPADRIRAERFLPG
jgi:ferredoxin-NADP reductase